MESKSEVRKFIKEKLALQKDKLTGYSDIICNKIIASKEFENADYIFTYSALFDEVDLTSVIQKSFELGKKVALPKIIIETSSMIFSEITQIDYDELEKGYCGIKEPDKEPLEINHLDGNVLVLTPGRAFTLDGRRLGRGKGFYDRYFNQISKKEVKKMGVCFDLQIVTELPVDSFDVQMDLIVFN